MTTSDKVVKIAENEAKVFEKGRQAEYDAFWDAYQRNHGAVQSYEYAFCNSGWNDETFKPKYDIVMGLGYTGTNTFWRCGVSNIAEALERQGVKLDTTLCGYAYSMFQNTKTSRLPELNFTHAMDYGTSGLQYTFTNSSIETIDKIIVVENLNYKSTFQGCDKLKNIVFEGTIGRNINFQWSPLSRESIISVVYALSDSANGQTATFNRSAVNTAFETSEGAADGSTSAEWQEVIATKSNWNISLV